MCNRADARNRRMGTLGKERFCGGPISALHPYLASVSQQTITVPSGRAL